MTIQFRRVFSLISYYKVRQSSFIAKCDRLLLTSTSGTTICDILLIQSASCITKCDRLYYKERPVLQSATVITKWGTANLLFELFKLWFHHDLHNFHIHM